MNSCRFAALDNDEAMHDVAMPSSGDSTACQQRTHEVKAMTRAARNSRGVTRMLCTLADQCRNDFSGPLAKVLHLERGYRWICPDPMQEHEVEADDACTTSSPPRLFGLDCELVTVRPTSPTPTDDDGGAHVLPDMSCVARVSLVEVSPTTGELIRTALDAYVRPPEGFEVADYRTHVSGVTEAHLYSNDGEGVLQSPAEARDAVFKLVQRRDVVCVHSGTTDLMALAFLPSRVLDTSGIVTVEDAPRWTLSLKDVANHVMGGSYHARHEGLVGEVLGCGVPADSSFQSHWNQSHDSTLDALWCARVAVGIALRKLAEIPPVRQMRSLPDSVQSRWGIAGIPPGWDAERVRKLLYYLLFRGADAKHRSAVFERVVESLKQMEVKTPKYAAISTPTQTATATPMPPRGGNTQVEFAEPSGALAAYRALMEPQLMTMDHNGHAKKAFAMTPHMYAWCTSSRSADSALSALSTGARRLLDEGNPGANSKASSGQKKGQKKRSRDDAEPPPPGVEPGVAANGASEPGEVSPPSSPEPFQDHAPTSFSADMLPPFVEIRLFQRATPDEVLYLDRREAGRVIGRGGRRVKHIKALSNAEVRVSGQSDSGDAKKVKQKVEIFGTSVAVMEARKLIRCAAAGDALGVE